MTRLATGTVLLALWAGLTAVAAAAAPATIGYRAVAAPGDDGLPRYPVTDQPTLALAATQALNDCRSAEPLTACELISLDGTPLSTARQLRAAAAGQGSRLFLWQYRHNDTTLYLGGTIHQLKRALYPLDARFEEAFAAADTLVLEVDLRRYPPELIQQETLKRAMLPPNQTLDALLTPQEQNRLQAQGDRYGIDLSMLQRFSPMLVSQLFAVTSLSTLGYSPDSGVEDHFLDRIGDKRVLELETLELQLDLLFSQPLSTQTEMLVTMLDQFDDTAAWLEGLVRAWLGGDADELERLFRQQSGDSPAARAFEKALLDDRNHSMAGQLVEFLKTGQGTYLVLVGAAHLVGEQGLLSLLERQGFEGTQLRRR